MCWIKANYLRDWKDFSDCLNPPVCRSLSYRMIENRHVFRVSFRDYDRLLKKKKA